MASVFDCAVYCPVLLWIVSSRLLCLARCLCLCVVCWVLSLRLTRLFMVLGLENFCASLFGGEGGSLERVSLFFAVLVTDSWASGVARLAFLRAIGSAHCCRTTDSYTPASSGANRLALI